MMNDLAEMARQTFLSRYSLNGHISEPTKENKRKSQAVNFCGKCAEPFQNGIRHRIRVDHQRKGRKWMPNGMEVMYVCSGCWLTMLSILDGGF